MRILVGMVLGLLSGLMIYFGSALASGGGEISSTFVAVTFLGGWVFSAFLMVNGARSVSRVFSRGFLIGAAEWLALIPIGMIFSGMAASSVVSENASGAELAGAAVGAGIFSVLTGGVAIFMALVCLIGFAVSYFIGRELKAEGPTPTLACPECAEMIQKNALKCRYCGAQIVASARVDRQRPDSKLVGVHPPPAHTPQPVETPPAR